MLIGVAGTALAVTGVSSIGDPALMPILAAELLLGAMFVRLDHGVTGGMRALLVERDGRMGAASLKLPALAGRPGAGRRDRSGGDAEPPAQARVVGPSTATVLGHQPWVTMQGAPDGASPACDGLPERTTSPVPAVEMAAPEKLQGPVGTTPRLHGSPVRYPRRHCQTRTVLAEPTSAASYPSITPAWTWPSGSKLAPTAQRAPSRRSTWVARVTGETKRSMLCCE